MKIDHPPPIHGWAVWAKLAVASPPKAQALRPSARGAHTRHRSQPQRTGALLRVNCSLYALRSLYRYSFRIARGIFMSLKCGRAEYFIGILPKRKTRENMHMCICMCVGILFVRMANLNIKSLNESARCDCETVCRYKRARERERERDRQTDRQTDRDACT